MSRDFRNWLTSFIIEVIVYAVLVVGYYLLVLHLMGDWLSHFFKTNIAKYTAISLVLIIAQGVMLEWITRLILGWIRSLREGT